MKTSDGGVNCCQHVLWIIQNKGDTVFKETFFFSVVISTHKSPLTSSVLRWR